MAKFLVQAKGGIILFAADKQGKVFRERIPKGKIVDFTASQCKLYAAKGIVVDTDESADEMEGAAQEQFDALMKRSKDELEGILVEAEVEYPEKATKAELAKIILENVDVETE